MKVVLSYVEPGSVRVPWKVYFTASVSWVEAFPITREEKETYGKTRCVGTKPSVLLACVVKALKRPHWLPPPFYTVLRTPKI